VLPLPEDWESGFQSAVIDHVSDLKLQYLVELSKLGDRCAVIESEVEQWLVEHGFVYGERTIPFVIMPHFISPGQLRRLGGAVAAISPMLDRFCEAYCDDARLRDELQLSPREDALMRIDPGFPQPIRVSRLDAFLHDYDVKFLEFNTDSPAGMGWTDVLYEALRQKVELARVGDVFDTGYTPVLPEVVDTLLDAYRACREAQPDLPETPRLAVVDVAGTPTVAEFRLVCRLAEQADLETMVATLDDLAYDGSRLMVGGSPVQLVYRRALVEALTEDSPLAIAAREGRAVVVNPFRVHVAANKKILALLQDERFEHLLTRAEAETIRQTVPWTRILRRGRTTYGDWRFELLSFVCDNRERLVLKPATDYGGRGVMLGIETDQEAWEGAIEEHVDGGDFIVQEYVPIPEEMFPTIEGGHVQMRLKRFNINPYCVGGRYVGMMTRISDQAVINVAAGGGILPSVVGRHKRQLLLEQDQESSQ
jgi:Glutathionylspermidine synthase preATP-grasp